MEQFIQFFVIAVLIERITEWIKQIFGDALPAKIGHVSAYLVLSFGVAVLITAALGVDIFAEMGLNFNIPYLGTILTAWAVSGGANYLFDLLRSFREPMKPALNIDVENVENVNAVEK